MRTSLKVLSDDERAGVHERSLRVLARSGVRVETAQGRRFLREAGAEVDETSHLVRFPRGLVEESLRLAPKTFMLGARRPGWDLPLNSGGCTMLVDGEAVSVLDRHTGERRPGTTQDWLEATRLIDALDEVGVWWFMVDRSDRGDTLADKVQYWRDLFANFSKHVQDSLDRARHAPWLLEVLQVIFGDQETVRQWHPLSFLLCPQSPLILDGPHTDAYLALRGWDIPVAIMPMPLMGATAPASLLATTVVGNCEVLAMLCLLQAAAPGTPVIYAPALAVANPRTAGYGGGPIEHGLLGAACAEMGRYYGLPVEASGFGSDSHRPGIQAAYERAMNGLLPSLSWPDILVGPGLLGGSMILSLEQLLLDVEMFRMAQRAARGITPGEGGWLDDELDRIRPGDHFLDRRSTVRAVRSGAWHLSDLGVHGSWETWEAAGRPALLDQVRERVDQILASHQPLPLSPEVERELARLRQRAAAASPGDGRAQTLGSP
jgi:trimethylamine--corrinoid protein Co-methyltransferase